MDLASLTHGLTHQLGGYREHRPGPALARVAEAVWTHEAPACLTGMEGVHRVLPDPALNLAFRCHRARGGWPTGPRLVVIGPKSRPFLFRFRSGDEIAAVKVKLEWARPLLGLDPAAHLDRDDDITEALAGGPELLDALCGTGSADEACALMVRSVTERLRGQEAAVSATSATALDLVRATTGRVRVDAVARRMGISLRQLRRAVRTETAISLKAYARI